MSMETEEASTTSLRQSVDARTEETKCSTTRGPLVHMSPFRNRFVSHRTIPPHAIGGRRPESGRVNGKSTVTRGPRVVELRLDSPIRACTFCRCDGLLAFFVNAYQLCGCPSLQLRFRGCRCPLFSMERSSSASVPSFRPPWSSTPTRSRS